MRVLIAGFGPFPGAPSNPSGRLARALARRRRPALADTEIASHVFATTYAAVDRDLPKLMAQRPDVVLIFGLAAHRRHISIETRARNARSLLFPDANGYRPARTMIEPGQASALGGNTPFARLLHAVRQTGRPARLSRDAGSYLCNYAYWRALAQVRNGHTLVQFVHIPRIGLTPRRRKTFKRRLPAFVQLVTAGENLLIALIAARRHSRPFTSAAHPSPGSARFRNRSSCAKSAQQNARAPRTRWRQAAKIVRSPPP
jgi:pyroglutamyl-peptidase